MSSKMKDPISKRKMMKMLSKWLVIVNKSQIVKRKFLNYYLTQKLKPFLMMSYWLKHSKFRKLQQKKLKSRSKNQLYSKNKLQKPVTHIEKLVSEDLFCSLLSKILILSILCINTRYNTSKIYLMLLWNKLLNLRILLKEILILLIVLLS